MLQNAKPICMDYLLFSEVAQILHHHIMSQCLTEQTPSEKWTAGAEGGTQWHPVHSTPPHSTRGL